MRTISPARILRVATRNRPTLEFRSARNARQLVDTEIEYRNVSDTLEMLYGKSMSVMLNAHENGIHYISKK